MTREEFDAFCASLPATTHVVQWGAASVWKVGGKIFAICSNWGEEAKDHPSKNLAEVKISFKCSDLAFRLLPEQQGIIPAPYLARAKWVQIEEQNAMCDEDIKSHIEAAHEIIGKKLTKKLQKELGLEWA